MILILKRLYDLCEKCYLILKIELHMKCLTYLLKDQRSMVRKDFSADNIEDFY